VSFNGPITVDAVALIKDAAGNVTRLREIGDVTAVVPEPGSLLLALLGLGSAALVYRRDVSRRPGALRLAAQG
jgi:PEP-CTERM motif